MRSYLAAFGCAVPIALVLAAACPAQTATWTQKQPANSPSARWSLGMAQDFIRQRTILFGGQATSGFLNETWEYDGNNWTQIQTTNSPPARRLHTIVYHFLRLNTVLFGGLTASSGLLNDTWTYDGRDWKQMQPANSPPARYAGAMAYDSARDRVVLFGGYSGSGFLGDTWEWDGSNWTQKTPTNSPTARYTTMTYDSARKRCVVFGGYAGAAIQDTWEWDGNNWTQMSPTNQPAARCCLCLVFDSDRNRTVMFGGWIGTALGETWEYDGNTWTQVNPTTSPPPRWDFDIGVYDSRGKRTIIFGGYSGSGYLGDTWEYSAAQTLTASPATVSISSGGSQQFTLNAGSQHASRSYWVLGSVTGTSPGVTLASNAGSVTMPLNPDLWTDITIGFANSALLTNTRAALDGSGNGTASFNIPKANLPSAVGVVFYHAYLVYDAQNNFHMASNPVQLRLVQ